MPSLLTQTQSLIVPKNRAVSCSKTTAGGLTSPPRIIRERPEEAPSSHDPATAPHGLHARLRALSKKNPFEFRERKIHPRRGSCQAVLMT